MTGAEPACCFAALMAVFSGDLFRGLPRSQRSLGRTASRTKSFSLVGFVGAENKPLMWFQLPFLCQIGESLGIELGQLEQIFVFRLK